MESKMDRDGKSRAWCQAVGAILETLGPKMPPKISQDGLEYPKIGPSWPKNNPAIAILEALGPKMPPKNRSRWPGVPQDRPKLAQKESQDSPKTW